MVLDLSGVDFIDSSALGTILRAAQSLEASAKRLHVVAPEGPVRRLLEMGLVPGTAVTLRRVAPLGDPIELHVRNYALSIRRDEAGGIEIE